jgi:hypothetical protein
MPLSRVALVIAAASTLACGVAIAGADDPERDAAGEVAMSGGEEGRVLGKCAFDAAASGYPPFEALGGEAPRRTLTRASERLAELERDLDTMKRHADPEHPEVISELTDASTLLSETRNAVAAASVAETVDQARLDDVVALVEASQQRMHVVRQQRVAAHAM